MNDTWAECYILANALISSGRRDEALAALERMQPRGAAMWNVLRTPALDPVRNRPRFQRLVDESRTPGVPR